LFVEVIVIRFSISFLLGFPLALFVVFSHATLAGPV